MGGGNRISKTNKKKGFESWQIQVPERRGHRGKMPSPPHRLTSQEPVLLSREGLMLGLEASLRECSESLRAKIFDQ